MTDAEIKVLIERLEHERQWRQRDEMEWRLYAETASALTQLRAERQWRPIRTAPKDAYLLLWARQYNRPAIGRWAGPDDVHEMFEWCTEDDAMLKVPTHWMPLPAPIAQVVQPKLNT